MKSLCAPILLALAACGPPAVDPVLAPEGWSDDASVLALIDGLVEKVRSNPDVAGTHRELGYAYLTNSAWPQAVQSLRHAQSLAPDDFEVRYHLAEALAETGELDERLSVLEGMIEDMATYTPALYHLGIEYLDRDRLEDAAKAFQGVETQQPKLPHGAIGLGEVAMARGNPQVAVDHFERALELAPGESYARLQLGQAYAQLGNAKRAQALSEAVAGTGRPRMNPPSVSKMERYQVSWGARLNRAIGHLGREEAGPALVLLEALHEEDPEQEVCLNNLAVAYMRLGRFDEALATIDKALAVKPEQHESLWNRASCYYKKGLIEREAGKEKEAEAFLVQALDTLKECIRISPRMPRAFSLRAKIQIARKQVPEAIQAFRNAIVQGDTSEETYLTLARAVIPHEGQEAALRVLQDSVAVPGARLDSRFQLCGMLLGMQRGEEARAIQRQMVEVDPKHPLTQQAHRILQQRGF